MSESWTTCLGVGVVDMVALEVEEGGDEEKDRREGEEDELSSKLLTEDEGEEDRTQREKEGACRGLTAGRESDEESRKRVERASIRVSGR